MGKPQLSSNYDKAATREWLTYEFWTPAQFAVNNDLSERSVRHLMTLGLPSHGRPHKGSTSGGIRLGRSAIRWLEMYRERTAAGRGLCRFHAQHVSPEFVFSLDLPDEARAFARLYNRPIPHDEYDDDPEEVRSWKKEFKEVKR